MDPQHSKCDYCDKVFSQRFNMLKHIRIVHGVNCFTNLRRIKCDCEVEFSDMKSLRKHVAKIHSITLEKEEFSFLTIADFNAWKLSVEKETCSSYILHRSPHAVSGGMKSSYMCHRSGYYKSSGAGKRNIQGLGSKKIDAFCPASLEVFSTDAEVFVTFHKTHYGHNKDIGHLQLTKEEKENIAGQLKEGISIQRILDDVRNSVTGTLNRIHLLNKQDIANIKRDFNVSNNDIYHPNDKVSVRIWVEQMRSLEESTCPVLLYKEQGSADCKKMLKEDDFMLVIMTKQQKKMLHLCEKTVCIDSTHGTNAYDFQLTTVLSIDEFGAGFPIAFCLSNHIDEVSMRVFFQILKDSVGEIKTESFMSDDALAYYNAWCGVMGLPEKKLLCTWHVNKNWILNLKKIPENTELRCQVYKTLCVLLEEPNIEKFEMMERNFCNFLLQNATTQDFLKYYVEYYSNRTEMWASCYRKNVGLQTNMHLEAMHKTLKYLYLEGKKVKRVDKAIHAIIKFVRDKVFDKLIRITKNPSSKKVKKIMNSHCTSMQIGESQIVSTEQDVWMVKSSSDFSKTYRVQKVSNPKCIFQCGLKCLHCKICVHMYNCSCRDNMHYFNICKHIHACVKGESANDSAVTAPLPEAEELIANVIADPISHNSSLREESLRIRSKLKLVDNMILQGSFDDERLRIINNYVDKILVMGSSSFATPLDIKKEPGNKKIKIQPTFKSTRNKRKRQPSAITKPTEDEKYNITNSLQDQIYIAKLSASDTDSADESEDIFIHTGSDHIYC